LYPFLTEDLMLFCGGTNFQALGTCASGKHGSPREAMGYPITGITWFHVYRKIHWKLLIAYTSQRYEA